MRSIDRVIPDSLVDLVLQHIKNSRWSYGWRSTRDMGYAHWNIDFADADSSNGLDISNRLPDCMDQLWQHLRSTHFPDTTLVRCYTNSHTYGIEGYPHTDSGRCGEQTLVIYLNREWRREWGGETMIYDDQEVVHAELPLFNRGLVFDSDRYHCARGVTRICPVQRITLMFKFGKQNADPVRDRLQLFLEQNGAQNLDHSGRSLFNHLLQVYDILQRHGAPESVCLAGGAHSVFGTTIYQLQLLQPEQRSDLVEVIGHRAADLIDLFRTLDRPRVLENWCHNTASPVTTWEGNKLDLDTDTVKDLCALESANLVSQKSLKRHSGLFRFWQNYSQ